MRYKIAQQDFRFLEGVRRCLDDPSSYTTSLIRLTKGDQLYRYCCMGLFCELAVD